jgi:hypothetical protein
VKQKMAAPFARRRGFLLHAARRASGGAKGEDREEEHDLCSAERDQRGSE